MKKYLYGFIATATLALAACATEEIPTPKQTAPQQTPDQSVAGELIVKFSPAVSQILDEQTVMATRSGKQATRSGIFTVDEVLNLVGGYQIERVFPIDVRSEQLAREAELHLWYVVRFDANHTLEEVSRKLSTLGEVQQVTPNRTIQRAYNSNKRATPLSKKTLEAVQHMTRADAAAYPFNDPLLSQQWHMINRGDMFGNKSIVGADVQVEKAWELATGNPSIIVAVLDEGVMLTHPDLKESIWVNENETYLSKKDNDGNGYAGDRHGYNFVSNTGVISWDNILDTGHGTHVAGVIAARNGNGEGICSVAGGSSSKPGVKIMSCQIFSGNTAISSVGQVRAIKYAADNGAVILQCSWGYNSGLASAYDNMPGYTSEEQWIEARPLEKTALDYFIHNAGSPNGVIDGGIAIFASGNETAAMAGFPGGGKDYISVSATAADFTPAIYTNYGLGTTIAGPGGDQDYYYDYGTSEAPGRSGTILSTLPPAISETQYGYMEGTSMACPHVSGVVALALSYAADQRRHFTADEIKALLYANTSEIDSHITGTKFYYRYVGDLGQTQPMQMELAPYKNRMGVGQVNAEKLLKAMAGKGAEISFPNLYIKLNGTVSAIPANYFMDGDALTYTVSIADQAISTSSASGQKLIFKGLKSGVTKATIKASNGKTHAFNITVRNNANGSGWL